MQGDDRERFHVRITGRVQGVFFRDSTREKAEELGLSGWVKNVPDGVEAVFEGPPEKIREAVARSLGRAHYRTTRQAMTD